MMNPTIVGVDIGGSHITAAQVDAFCKVKPGALVRRSINSSEKADRIIREWAAAIRSIWDEPDTASVYIGIAMPGPFDYENGISYIRNQGKYDALYNLNVKELLAGELHVAAENILFKNDAAGFLQGEAVAGVAKGYSKVIGLTLGTGLGAAVCTQQLSLDADRWNFPFKQGIAEDYLSARWFLSRYKELSGNSITEVKQLALAGPDEGAAKQIFDEFGENLGLFLSDFIRQEQPEAIVLGGNISKAFDRFSKALRRVIDSWFHGLPVLKAQLGDEAALIGAASLWVNKE